LGAFGGLILTNKGRNLQLKAQTGKPLNFTRIALGDGTLGGTSILDLNALRNERKSLNITKLKVLGDGKVVVGGVFSNSDITTGFYWREIGLFAMDPDIGEILYSYGNSGSNAEFIPAGGGADIVEKTIDLITIVGNAANVSATIDQSLVFETPEGAQEKADEAEENAKAYTDQRIASIVIPVQSVNGKTGNVNLTASDVGAETPSGAQAKANTAENNAKSYADNKAVTAENNAKAYADTKAAQAETNAKNYAAGLNTVALVDTRSTNELPSYYLTSANGKKVHFEFKQRAAIGIPSSSGTYCLLITIVQWTDTSGGTVKQLAYDESGRVFIRTSNGTSAWNSWQEFETTAGAQSKATTAENNAKAYADQVAATAEANAKAASAPISHVGAGGSAHATATQTTAGFMSASDKAKLDGIQSGAEVNQNTFANVKVGATTIAADTKQDTLELAAGTGVVLTPDAANDKVTIAVNTASTSQAGIVQLVDSVSSTSTTQAPTANAVKQANDNANNRVSKSGDTMTGRLQFGAGQDIAPDAVSGTAPSQGIRFSADTDIFDLFLRTDNTGEKSGLILALGDNSDDYFQIEQVSPSGEATPTKLFKISETEGANVYTTLKVNGNVVWHAGNDGAGSGLDADTVDGKHFSDIQADAQAKANQAEANAKAYTDSAPEAMQRNLGIFNVYKSGKDSNGIFTIVEYKRADGKLFARSVLSGGTSPQYTTRTVTYYAADGTTVLRTDTYTLTYDTDGDLISEVKQ
jgi:hypothetical protein